MLAILPFALSAIFPIIWVPILVVKGGADLQATLQTAFGIASYIVTAGWLSENPAKPVF